MRNNDQQIETANYLRAVYLAHAALKDPDPARIRRAIERLRKVAPDHSMLAALEARLEALDMRPQARH